MLAKAEKEYGFGGGSSNNYFKLKEGENKVRVLTWLEPIGEHYKPNADDNGICLGAEICPTCKNNVNKPEKEQNKRNVRFMCYVYDYVDGIIKLAKLPYKIMQGLQALQASSMTAFSGMPMPYDIDIHAKDAGKTTVVYTILTARTNTDIPEKVLTDLSKKFTPEQIKERMKEKRMEALGLKSPTPKAEIGTNLANDPGFEYPTSEEEGIDPSQIPF